MSKKEKIDMDHSPNWIYVGIQYMDVRDIQESTGDEEMPVIINALHFYDDDEPVQSNMFDTLKFTRDIVPTRRRF